MDEAIWAEIHRLSHNEKFKNRAIARQLGIHRETVRLALNSDHCPKRSPAARGSLLDPYVGDIEGILKRYPKLSGVRVFEKLCALGYPGKITVVRDLLAELRPRRPREAFLKRETLPGVEAQADWGSCGSIVREGVIRPLSVFVMALSFSRVLYVEFTTSQEMEDFLRCHVNAPTFRRLLSGLQGDFLGLCGAYVPSSTPRVCYSRFDVGLTVPARRPVCPVTRRGIVFRQDSSGSRSIRRRSSAAPPAGQGAVAVTASA